mgnify:FL=1|jgi:hypothetical protein
MPNTIILAKNFAPLLDEVYQRESVTRDLTGDPAMARAGANAKEIVYPQIAVTGLGDYDRNSGYTKGTVDFKWVTTEYNYDRGAKLSVDAMDDQETYKLAFGMAGAELMRTRVAPEADAFTFATLAGTKGISKGEAKTITTAEDFLAELLIAKSKMDNDEVPEEGRILYATSDLLNALLMMDTYKSKEILAAYTIKKPVPQSRFYTSIDMLDGRSPDENAGHYRKGTAKYEKTTDTSVVSGKTYYTEGGGVYSKVTSPETSAIGTYYEMVQEAAKNINFMIIHKPAIIKHDKHVVSNIIPADLNPDADADILKYRKYGIVDVYKNKVAGIYLSHQA